MLSFIPNPLQKTLLPPPLLYPFLRGQPIFSRWDSEQTEKFKQLGRILMSLGRQ